MEGGGACENAAANALRIPPPSPPLHNQRIIHRAARDRPPRGHVLGRRNAGMAERDGAGRRRNPARSRTARRWFGGRARRRPGVAREPNAGRQDSVRVQPLGRGKWSDSLSQIVPLRQRQSGSGWFRVVRRRGTTRLMDAAADAFWDSFERPWDDPRAANVEGAQQPEVPWRALSRWCVHPPELGCSGSFRSRTRKVLTAGLARAAASLRP
jgi:hypothetical protein